MKVAFTISDAVHAAMIGGEVERETVIIEIPESQIPKQITDYFEARKKPNHFLSHSISLIAEPKP